ncbi:exocyst complex component EXO70B1 [Amborella trichopoda]|uniref:Exocyst subunit Exo70 family protein n=1 Tax=Amborella trichopoda TaxID=13333 RepID=W1PMJ7_AMBTC|nr:exocyst complex component EXO70B1 [Amborella trichopoda]ERN09019.1 hypothetical protein AMTR_s00153p00086670 [Amborella trichopoda]|eukprot:XP_006847438.1 exocyst complex component EXO70B1 [Amborella trichopoda]
MENVPQRTHSFPGNLLRKNDHEKPEIMSEGRYDSPKNRHDLDLDQIPAVSTTPETPHCEDLDSFTSDLESFLASIAGKDQKPEPPACVESFSEKLSGKILKWESGDRLNWFSGDDSGQFLESIDLVWRLSQALPEHQKLAVVLQQSMAFLEEELRSLLEDSNDLESDNDRYVIPHPLENDSPVKSGKDSSDEKQEDSSDQKHVSDQIPAVFDAYSPENLALISRIARIMIKAGYETECLQVFSIARRKLFEGSLAKLGFERISIEDVQKMQWETLETEIGKWMKAFRRIVTFYFPSEQRLCEEVFGKGAMADSLFQNLARGVVIQLLNFAEAVAMSKRSAEKLFKFLDMYETLRDVASSIASGLCWTELCVEIESARSRLGDAAVGIFAELESAIHGDAARTPVPGGAVHPLTRYVMNYLKLTCEYKEPLEQVFLEHRVTAASPKKEQKNSPEMSPLGLQLAGIMDLLDKNLEAKSKLYKDLSLSYVFLMNNGRYIVQKIKDSEIYALLGDVWCRKRSSELRHYHKSYQRETWTKVLACLKDEGLHAKGNFSSGVSKAALKERFKQFNTQFEEIHKTQSSWIVSDEQLQSELRIAVSSVVIPAYRSFLGRFSQYLDGGRQADKYIKYGPEELEACIDDLFEGTPPSMIKRKG